jgi:hypothetical protein
MNNKIINKDIINDQTRQQAQLFCFSSKWVALLFFMTNNIKEYTVS